MGKMNQLSLTLPPPARPAPVAGPLKGTLRSFQHVPGFYNWTFTDLDRNTGELIRECGIEWRLTKQKIPAHWSSKDKRTREWIREQWIEVAVSKTFNRNF